MFKTASHCMGGVIVTTGVGMGVRAHQGFVLNKRQCSKTHEEPAGESQVF
jgi:hypothetical protein